MVAFNNKENTLELIEQLSLSNVMLFSLGSLLYSNTGRIRDDPYWIPMKNSLRPIELSSITKVSLA